MRHYLMIITHHTYQNHTFYSYPHFSLARQHNTVETTSVDVTSTSSELKSSKNISIGELVSVFACSTVLEGIGKDRLPCIDLHRDLNGFI